MTPSRCLCLQEAPTGHLLCSLKDIDVVVLDQQLPDAEGHTLCETILTYNEQTKIIFSTAFPSFENAVKAIRSGAYDYLSKPYDLEELALAVKQAFRTLELEHVEQIHDYQRAQEKKGAVIIGGTGLADTLRLTDLAASTDSPVLITGETGTGKTLLAKTIHYKWRASKAPFISINCASLPETLIEAELFGYERGAFTGAVGAKKGLFEMADGGTLFLDEIGEVPFHLQSSSSTIEENHPRIGTPNKRQRRIMAATAWTKKRSAKTGKTLLLERGPDTFPPLRERQNRPLLPDQKPVSHGSGTDSEMARSWNTNGRECAN
jgi:DNA-binding NtrC family response regulator